MSSRPDAVLSGSCMCGSVTYDSTELPSSLDHCHCVTCRKLSGAAFLTFAEYPRAAITWTSGEDHIKKVKYSEMAERGHCQNCGSPLYMMYKFEPQQIGITAGTIDDSTVKGALPKPSQHIFVKEGEKAAWYDLPDDDLPKHETFSANYQRKVDTWKDDVQPLK